MTIEILPWNPAWPARFQALAADLRTLDGVVGIHHIGSTSIEGMPAKDRIDIQLSVEALDDRLRPELEARGYEWLGSPTDRTPPTLTLDESDVAKRLAVGRDPDANVHIRVQGRWNHRYPLLFRDYLRTHPVAAAAYGATKKLAARLFPDDQERYYDLKDPAFDLIITGAEEWAMRVDWTTPGSD